MVCSRFTASTHYRDDRIGGKHDDTDTQFLGGRNGGRGIDNSCSHGGAHGTIAAHRGYAAPHTQQGAGSRITLPIIIHLSTALSAVVLGPFILARRKGDALHRAFGRVWVALMLTTAIASAFIRAPGGGIAGTGFSFIHLFTIWTLIVVPLAVIAARQGKIEAHRGAMKGLYAGLCIAGAFTLIPGRLLGSVVFG